MTKILSLRPGLGIESEVTSFDADTIPEDAVDATYVEAVSDAEQTDSEIEAEENNIIQLQNDTHTLSEINTVISESSQISEESYKLITLSLENIYARYGIGVQEVLPSMEDFNNNPSMINVISQEKILDTVKAFGKATVDGVKKVIAAIMNFFKNVFNKIMGLFKRKTDDNIKDNEKTKEQPEQRAEEPFVSTAMQKVYDNPEEYPNAKLTPLALELVQRAKRVRKEKKELEHGVIQLGKRVETLQIKHKKGTALAGTKVDDLLKAVDAKTWETEYLTNTTTGKPYSLDEILGHLATVEKSAMAWRTAFTKFNGYSKREMHDYEFFAKYNSELWNKFDTIQYYDKITDSKYDVPHMGFEIRFSHTTMPEVVRTAVQPSKDAFDPEAADKRASVLKALVSAVQQTERHVSWIVGNVGFWKWIEGDKYNPNDAKHVNMYYFYKAVHKHISLLNHVFKSINSGLESQIKIALLEGLIVRNIK